MVLEPLGALHVMFALMGAAMVVAGKRLRAGHGLPPPVPEFLASV